MTSVESKVLNFPDAMRLSQIISKYLDTVSIKEMTGEEFAYDIFSQMEVEEIMEVSKLFRIENIEELDPPQVIFVCIEGMVKNNLLTLIETYKKIGFG